MRTRAHVAAAVGIGLVAALILASAVRSGAARNETEVIDATVRGINAAQNAASVQPDSSALKEVNVKLTSVGQYAEYLRLPSNYSTQMTSSAADLSSVLAGEQLKSASEIARAEQERLKTVSTQLRSLPTEAGAETVDYTWSGGADQFEFSSIDIQETTAVLKGTARLWASGVAAGNGWLSIFSPEGLNHFEVHLIRDGETWKVSQIGLDKVVPADKAS